MISAFLKEIAELMLQVAFYFVEAVFGGSTNTIFSEFNFLSAYVEGTSSSNEMNSTLQWLYSGFKIGGVSICDFITVVAWVILITLTIYQGIAILSGQLRQRQSSFGPFLVRLVLSTLLLVPISKDGANTYLWVMILQDFVLAPISSLFNIIGNTFLPYVANVEGANTYGAVLGSIGEGLFSAVCGAWNVLTGTWSEVAGNAASAFMTIALGFSIISATIGWLTRYMWLALTIFVAPLPIALNANDSSSASFSEWLKSLFGQIIGLFIHFLLFFVGLVYVKGHLSGITSGSDSIIFLIVATGLFSAAAGCEQILSLLNFKTMPSVKEAANAVKGGINDVRVAGQAIGAGTAAVAGASTVMGVGGDAVRGVKSYGGEDHKWTWNGVKESFKENVETAKAAAGYKLGLMTREQAAEHASYIDPRTGDLKFNLLSNDSADRKDLAKAQAIMEYDKKEARAEKEKEMLGTQRGQDLAKTEAENKTATETITNNIKASDSNWINAKNNLKNKESGDSSGNQGNTFDNDAVGENGSELPKSSFNEVDEISEINPSISKTSKLNSKKQKDDDPLDLEEFNLNENQAENKPVDIPLNKNPKE